MHFFHILEKQLFFIFINNNKKESNIHMNTYVLVKKYIAYLVSQRLLVLCFLVFLYQIIQFYYYRLNLHTTNPHESPILTDSLIKTEPTLTECSSYWLNGLFCLFLHFFRLSFISIIHSHILLYVHLRLGCSFIMVVYFYERFDNRNEYN